MPGMDGYEATRIIRSREKPGVRVPILAVTAHALPDEREKVIAAGMDDHLTKPVTVRRLAEALGRWLGAAELDGTDDAPPSSTVTAALDPEVRRSAKVARLFLEQLPRQLEALTVAARSANATELRAAAHKLKGSCFGVGATRLAAVCEAMEAQPANAVARLADLEREHAAVRAALEAELSAAKA
jgi:HPt (histidine-containing phosphotransfer) domain-containing protein